MRKLLDVLLDHFIARIANTFAMFALLFAIYNELQWDVVATFVVSATLYIAQEIRLYHKINSSPSYFEQDKLIFEKLQSTLPNKYTIGYMRTHDFGGASQKSYIDPIYDFVNYFEKNPAEKFFDSELEVLRVELFKLCNDFTNTLSGFTTADDHLLIIDKIKRDAYHVSPTEQNKRWREDFYNSVHFLNSTADKIVKTYDDLTAKARLKLYKDKE